VSNRLCIRFPTRDRPQQALEVLEKYRRMAGVPCTIEVVTDHDDPTMLTPEVRYRLRELDCVHVIGEHDSKIAACNHETSVDWDVIMLASDDMVPVVGGFGAIVLEEMQKHFPDLDGALHFNDGHQGERLCTLPIFGRALYERMERQIYHPGYRSLFCDDEQTMLLKQMRRLKYIDRAPIIEHRHPAFKTAPVDALYHRNQSYADADRALFQQRYATIMPGSQFRFEQPPLWLSVLICTMPERKEKLDVLLRSLRADLWVAPDSYEILVDGGPGAVGEKRQRLLERAVGQFVAFVDDDDSVAHDYLERVITAIEENPTVDCIALRGVLLTDGEKPERFEHSIKYHDWGQDETGLHYRTPNHLNPIRRRLALQAGFRSLQTSEDYLFAQSIRPLLRSEAPAGDDPLYYYFLRSKTMDIVGRTAKDPREPITLITTVYPFKDPARQKEVLDCILANCEMPEIDRVVIFNEGGPRVIHPKVKQLDIDKRPTFGLFFDYARAELGGRVCVVVNSDIELACSIEHARKVEYNELWCVCRCNPVAIGKPTVAIDWQLQGNGQQGSADAWIFRAPIPKFREEEIEIGVVGCDSYLAQRAHEHGIKLFNPCHTITLRHRHESAERNDRPDGVGYWGKPDYKAFCVPPGAIK